MTRLAVLKNAPTLSSMPATRPERRHLLAGRRKGRYAVDLVPPMRLVFEPGHDPVPLTDDAEEDEWAADFLIPAQDWWRFVAAGAFDLESARRFADEQRIAPGIVAGRLQHERRAPWSRLNELKVKLRWAEVG